MDTRASLQGDYLMAQIELEQATRRHRVTEWALVEYLSEIILKELGTRELSKDDMKELVKRSLVPKLCNVIRRKTIAHLLKTGKMGYSQTKEKYTVAWNA